MKALIFGAGNIGRGFLGHLLGQSGSRPVFVDANQQLVKLINAQGQYTVTTASDSLTETIVRDASALHVSDVVGITRAIVEADIILTAVGKEQLAKVAPVLAAGLIERQRRRSKDGVHVIVVACENAQHNTSLLRDFVLQYVPSSLREGLLAEYSFPNCVVDRIVPSVVASRGGDPLDVMVEGYYQFVIDGQALKMPPPKIEGLVVSPNLDAVLEQKLFTLNMAHAVAAFWGYLRGCEFIHEAVGESDIRSLMTGALGEVESVLVARHATISPESQRIYASGIMQRFANTYLRDPVIRVARDPRRKLGELDRLVFPARCVEQGGAVPSFLASGIAAALHYDYGEDDQAQALVTAIRERGIAHVIQEVSGITPQSILAGLVKAQYLLRAL